MDTRQKLSDMLKALIVKDSAHGLENVSATVYQIEVCIAEAEAIEAASHQGRGEGKVFTEEDLNAAVLLTLRRVANMNEAGRAIAKLVAEEHGLTI